jgi:hypothetical protein
MLLPLPCPALPCPSLFMLLPFGFLSEHARLLPASSFCVPPSQFANLWSTVRACVRRCMPCRRFAAKGRSFYLFFFTTIRESRVYSRVQTHVVTTIYTYNTDSTF